MRIARSIISRYKTTSSPLIPTFNHSPAGSSHNNKVITYQISSLHNSSFSSSIYQRFGISSSASTQPNGKKTSKTGGTTSNDARSNVKKQGKKDSNIDDSQKIQEDIKNLKEKKVSPVGKKDSHTDDLQKLQEEIKMLKEKVVTKDNLQKLQEEIKNLKEKNASRERLKDTNTHDLKKMQEEIKKLKEKLVSRVVNKDSNTDDLQTMQEEIIKLKDKVVNMYSDMEDIRKLAISEAKNSKELKNDMRLLSVMILGSLVFSVSAYDILKKERQDKQKTES